MLSVSGKEYNLEILFQCQFETLKEVLTALARTNLEMKDDINSLQNLNKEKDKRIDELENQINFMKENNENKFNNIEINFNKLNDILNDLLKSQNDNKTKIEFVKIETPIEQKKEEVKIINESDIKQEIKDDKNNNMNINNLQESRNQNSNEENLNDNLDTNNINKNNIENDEKENYYIIDTEKKENSLDSNIFSNLINQLLKNVKENQRRIEELEQLSKELNVTNTNELNDLEMTIEKKIKEYNLKNDNLIKSIQTNLNELNDKNENNEKKIEDCLLKCANINIIEEIKDNGNGDIDSTKILIKALENKVFTKFNTIEERFKNSQIEFMKVKNLTESHNNSIEEIDLKIQMINDELEKLKKTLTNTTNKLNKKDTNLENQIKELSDNLVNISNFENLINEKEKALRDEFTKFKSNTNEKSNNLPSINSGIDLSLLEDKINEIQKKLSELDYQFKNNSNEKEIENLKKSIKDLKYELENKLTQNDLKELYDNHLINMNEINILKELMTPLTKNNKKILSEISNIYQKIDKNLDESNSSPRHLKTSMSNQNVNENNKLYDKVMNITKNLYQEVDKLKKQYECIQRDIEEIYSRLKNIPVNDDIKDLENRLIKNIDEFKQVSIRKFSDKYETNRTLKTIEIKIKQITEEKKVENAETWLLANRPLNNFKCASCEANISNLNPPKEYLPWNRLPARDEKQYRMGAGFSHKLNMLSQDYINNKENNNDNELKQRSFSGIKNNIQINNQNNNILVINNNKKIKLPKMESGKKKYFSLPEQPPVSEGDTGNTIEEKKETIITPKILKIIKHRKNNSYFSNEEGNNLNKDIILKNNNISQNFHISNDLNNSENYDNQEKSSEEKLE